jgi:hypothetical protein
LPVDAGCARFVARCADGAAFGAAAAAAAAADAAFDLAGTLGRLLRHGALCALHPAPAR